MRVSIWQIFQHHRSKIVCEAMAAGIRRAGDVPSRRWEREFTHFEGETAVFYGFVGKLPKIMGEAVKMGGRCVYIDLGYWQRRKGGRYQGFHKVSINARHPTAYFRARQHSTSRLRELGVTIRPWKEDGKHILVAGMSGKGALAEGFAPGQWEAETVRRLREVTDRTIIYRPKPSWVEARPIPGSLFSPSTQELADVLPGCHLIVTHHSNVAVDGLVEGIPVVAFDGVAAPMSSAIEAIDAPRRPDGRQEWAADIAWTQFSVAEMESGLVWRYLRDEGLV